MTYQDSDEFAYEPAAEEPPPRRLAFTIFVWVVLAGIGVGSGFIWHTYGSQLSSLPAIARSSPPPQIASSDLVPRKDFEDYRQKTAEDLQSKSQQLGVQQARIKQLSDQIADLVAKIESVERRQLSQVQASVPKAVAKKPKPRVAPNTSTGGAPLPLTTGEKR
jgi:hypothetical protein